MQLTIVHYFDLKRNYFFDHNYNEINKNNINISR